MADIQMKEPAKAAPVVAATSSPVSTLPPMAIPLIPQLSTWAKLQFDSDCNRNTWVVEPENIPEALNPVYAGYLGVSPLTTLFEAYARNPPKGAPIHERIANDEVAHIIVPHIMKTPGLMLLISARSAAGKFLRFPEYLPATTIYEGYRMHIEAYSFYRSTIEDANKTKSEQRFAMAMAEALNYGYEIMENLRKEVASIATTSEGSDTNAIEQFARVTWESTRAQLCALELVILMILGISPQRASLAGILSTANPTPPRVEVLAPEDIDECTKKCFQLGPLAGITSAAVTPSAYIPKEYVVPQWFLEGQLRAVIAAMKNTPQKQ